MYAWLNSAGWHIRVNVGCYWASILFMCARVLIARSYHTHDAINCGINKHEKCKQLLSSNKNLDYETHVLIKHQPDVFLSGIEM